MGGANGERRRRGVWCSPWRRKGARRWPATRTKAAARCGLWRRWGSGGLLVKWMRAQGRRRRGGADGAVAVAGASTVAPESEKKAFAAGGEEMRIPAKRERGSRSGWRRWTEEEEALPRLYL